jgi:Fe-S cluster biogenesis protein NfuA
MKYQIMVQGTPNPNALKFVLNTSVKTQGNVTYKNVTECDTNPLAAAIFSVSNVSEVYFFDNYITVTQDGHADWDELEEQIQRLILENIAGHNPDFAVKESPAKMQEKIPQSPEMIKINAILDRTVRPALQMDGGDLEIVSFEGNVLKIYYQGACGSCPSSTMGTMMAIENLLKEEYHPEIVVQMA